MSLSFLVPAFFVGLLALAVPLLIHLSRRQVRDPVHFPSLMFLRRVPQQTKSRRRIQRWFLLLLRALAIALLVLAFARPFLTRSDGSAILTGEGNREVVVLVDRSYSMGLGDRWDRAIASGLQVIDGLAPGDRGTVVLFDANAEAAIESSSDPGILQATLRRSTPGLSITRYAPALRYASRILGSSALPRHELVVISDFQRTGWDRDGGETGSLRLPAGTQVTLVPVSDSTEYGNMSIVDIQLERSSVAGRERVEVQAFLSRNGPGPAEHPVSLEVDGRVVETRSADFDEGGAATLTFNPLTLAEAGVSRATLRIPEDALPADNEFHFVLSSDQRLGVLLVNGTSAPSGASLFLEHALAIGNSPGFRVEVRREADLISADLARNPVVILNQMAMPGGTLGERLQQHVAEGGGLILVMGENALGDWPGVLPGNPGQTDRSAGGGTAIGYVDTGHPIFEPFAGPRNGDFGAARVYRYRTLAAGTFPRTLARFGDGGAALLENPIGLGRLLVWTSPLDGGWNDLALQPVFLPFLQQMTKYAAGYAPPRGWMTVGDALDPASGAPRGQDFSLLLTPSGEQLPVEVGTPLRFTEQGFFELRDPRAEGSAAVFAVNVDPAESDLTRFDFEEMRSALVIAAQGEQSRGTTAEVPLSDRERQQSGWWYVIIAVFLLLAGETLFSNRNEGNARYESRSAEGGQSSKKRPSVAA